MSANARDGFPCTFRKQPAGLLLVPELPRTSGDFPFLPLRSPGHLALADAIGDGERAVVEILSAAGSLKAEVLSLGPRTITIRL